MRACRGVLVVALLLPLGGCPPPPGGDGGPDGGIDAEPLFPADVADSYAEVRDCRTSIDHELVHVRVFADDLAHEPYTGRDAGFPEGAVVVKIEYADEGCTDVVGYTAMKKLAAGEGQEALGWHWQRTDASRKVLEDGAVRGCYTCHRSCEAPDGYDYTCTEP